MGLSEFKKMGDNEQDSFIKGMQPGVAQAEARKWKCKIESSRTFIRGVRLGRAYLLSSVPSRKLIYYQQTKYSTASTLLVVARSVRIEIIEGIDSSISLGKGSNSNTIVAAMFVWPSARGRLSGF